ncbi:MAG TPA: ABC transporter ATP-binding protein [Chloroflexaceae bacterium]|nr:ABC transporter ATP-binding protein [Chloroflexaceae bacterium]
MSDQGTASIVAEGLRKQLGGKPVLRDLELEVAPGAIFGLFGPSGSGKSTCIHLCCGHLRPDGGSLRVLGEEPARFSRATRRRIGYAAQQFTLSPDLTAAANVAFAAGLYGVPEWRSGPLVKTALELVDLWEARRVRARSLSGGMRRRLTLAAAIAHGPDLLFADEPTANLDPILRGRIWEHFRARAREGATLLITTQYIDEAEYCDRIGLMYDGALIAEGRPAELRRQAFGGDLVDVMVAGPSPSYLAGLAGVEGVRQTESAPDRAMRLVADDAQRAIPQLLQALQGAGAEVQSVAPYQPSFDEVFVRLIERHRAARAEGA